MAVAVPLIAGAVGQALATNLAWSVAANYAISTATFGAIVSVGGALGAALGAALIAPGLPDVEGPQALEGMAQVSTYGNFINVFYGRVRTGGNIIWSKGIREVKTTEEVGGKGGGGGQSVTTYTYYCSWALALGEGKVKDIHKIWFDADLIYDNTIVPATSSIPNFSDKVTFYYGSEDQLADPTIQAAEGASDTPSYRGLSYIVFDDLLLTDWGNRIPNITVELSRFPDSGMTSEIYPIEMDVDGFQSSTNYNSGLIKAINTYATQEPDQLLSGMQVDDITLRSVVVNMTIEPDQLLSGINVDSISTRTVVVNTSIEPDQLLSGMQVDSISTKTVVISTNIEPDQLLSSLAVNDIILTTI